MEVRRFEDGDIPGAASLLATRLQGLADRVSTTASPPRDEEAYAAAISGLRSAGAEGLVSHDRRGLAGYVIAARGDDHRGRHVWIDVAGHSYRDDSEMLRYLYAQLAQDWVRDGRDHHYVVVSSSDGGGIHAWFHLAFGHEQIHAARKTSVDAKGKNQSFSVRRVGAQDVNSVEPLFPLIYEAQAVSPVFAYIEPSFPDGLFEGHQELLNDTRVGYFIAEEEDKAIGYATMRPVPGEEATLIKAAGTIELIVAATLPRARGRGVMRILVETALTWAARQGFDVCITDWRAANLDSSVVWPRLGFTDVAYRLHRFIDPRVITMERTRE